jgi:hypothetical protein
MQGLLQLLVNRLYREKNYTQAKYADGAKVLHHAAADE